MKFERGCLACETMPERNTIKTEGTPDYFNMLLKLGAKIKVIPLFLLLFFHPLTLSQLNRFMKFNFIERLNSSV